MRESRSGKEIAGTSNWNTSSGHGGPTHKPPLTCELSHNLSYFLGCNFYHAYGRSACNYLISFPDLATFFCHSLASLQYQRRPASFVPAHHGSSCRLPDETSYNQGGCGQNVRDQDCIMDIIGHHDRNRSGTASYETSTQTTASF